MLENLRNLKEIRSALVSSLKKDFLLMFRSWMGRALLLVLMSLGLGAATASAATAEKGAHQKRSHIHRSGHTHPKAGVADAGGPLEGVFDDCPLYSELTVCEQRLQLAGQAGFQVLVLPLNDAQTYGQLQAYASVASTAGVKIMYDISNPNLWESSLDSPGQSDYSILPIANSSTTNGAYITQLVQELLALPATYGFYMADDSMVEPGDLQGLENESNLIHQVAGKNVPVVISASASQGTSEQAAANFLASELYPVTSQANLPVNKNLALWNGVQSQIQQAQKAATAHGDGSAFILQGFTFGDNVIDGQAVGTCSQEENPQKCYQANAYPSPALQHLLLSAVEQFTDDQAKLVLWYNLDETLGNPTPGPSYDIFPSGTVAQQRWAGLKQAIKPPFAKLNL